jgi:hypothetical protein
LFLLGAVAFAVAAMVLSSTFNWPDILREPASVVLPAFAGGGTGLVWTWFATGWTYAILAVPILLLPAVLGRRDDLALRVATYAGATSVVLALTGFLRWVFVVAAVAIPMRRRRLRQAAAGASVDRPASSTAARCSASTWASCSPSGWSVTLCVIILRNRVLPAGSAPPGSSSARCTCSTGATSQHRRPRLPGLGPGRRDQPFPAQESG